MKLTEPITKAAQCADLLCSDIRQAHKAAVRTNPLAEIVLRDAMETALKLRARLAEVQAAVEGA